MKRLRLRKAMLLAVGGLLGISAIGEGAGRWFGFGDPLLYRAGAAGYEPVPDQTVTRLGKTTRINGLGTRGDPAGSVPARAVLRILSLGDSVANGGTLVNDGEAYPALMQARLRAAGYRVEVLNASAGGWALGNAAAWLREHGTLGARLVVLELNDGDLDQPFADSGILDHNVSFPTRRPVSAIGEITTRYVLPRLGLAGPLNDPGSSMGAFQPAQVPAVMDALRAIDRQVRGSGATLTIMYWDLRTPPTPPRAAFRDQFLRTVAAMHVPVVRPNLAAQPQAERFFWDDVHPNVLGNTRIAERLSVAFAGVDLTKLDAAAAYQVRRPD